MNVGQELRLAIRLLAKERGFTLLAAVALGLGIGVSNTFFSLVNAAVLRGLPIDAPGRVMFLSLRDARNMTRGLAYPAYEVLRRDARTFASVGAYVTGPMTIRDGGASAERVLATSLSVSGFRALGVVPRLGREFRPEDDRPGASAVVLLGERVWHARYGGRPSVLGESVMLDGGPATVVGVMPESFRFPGNADVWRPLGADPGLAASSREPRLVSVFARLSRDASRAQAEAEFESFRAAWARVDPATYGPYRASIVPINQQLFGRVTDTVWLAFITAGALVFLIACANVANLLLMRAAARGREMAIRMSLGATRAQIMRQLLVESTVLAALGSVAGLGVSRVGLRTLQALVPTDVARLFAFTLDARMVAAMVGVSVASVFIFGLAPALHLARGSPVDVLKDDSQAGGTATRRRWATAFLAAEFALTLVLLTNVSMEIWTARAARDAQFPIDPAPLLTMSLTLPNRPYDTVEARNRFFGRVEETIAALPSVSWVAIASALPGAARPLQEVTIAGGLPLSVPRAGTLLISERYFDTIAARLVSGRAFTSIDGMPGQDTAIVNQRFVDLFLPVANPIGTLIRVAGSPGSDPAKPWLRIVGVAPSVRQSALDGIEPDPVVYLPARSAPSSTMSIIVRAQGEPAADPAVLTPPIRTAIRRLDPLLPVDRVMTMTEATRQLQWTGRISRVLLNGIGTISLLLALVGLYAVTTHSVRLRRKELGIRIALGASQRTVGALVLRRVLFQLAIGLAIGLGATVAFDRLFTTTGMRLTDPLVLLPSVSAILVVGIVACLWPAARAVRFDPVAALRDE